MFFQHGVVIGEGTRLVIQSIQITGFRGIQEGRLEELTPLVVLVGPNGCGKSTVLDAMLIGATRELGQSVLQVAKRHSGVHDRARWLFWRESSTAEIKTTLPDAITRKINLTLRDKQRSKSRVIAYHCFLQGDDWESDGGGGNVMLSIRNRQSRTQPLTKRGIVGATEPLVVDYDVRLVDVLDFDVPLHQLYSECVRVGRREYARKIVTDVVPGLTDIEILTEDETPVVYFVFQDRAVPGELAGDGVRMLLRLTLEMASREGGVLLVEEPEAHQHPAAIRQSVRALLAAVRRNVQVVLTTHSLELIDILLAESSDADMEKLSLYRLQLQNGEMQSRRMAGSEVAFARSEIESDLR